MEQFGFIKRERQPDITRYTALEYFIICLSYILLILTFPIAILFCLKTATVFERLVIFRLGRLRQGRAAGPGMVFMLPCIDKYILVDLRTRSFDVHPQEIITKDSVSIKVDAVVYYSISKPLDAVINIANVRLATKLLAQATLRTVVGMNYLSEVVGAKEALSKNVKIIMEKATEEWGITVERIEIKQIHLPDNMQRAMAIEQEADREAQAKIAAARGELDASKNLKAASDVMKSSPIALQLRYLQTLNSIASEDNHTIIFPFSINVMKRIILHLRGSLSDPHIPDQSSLNLQTDCCACEPSKANKTFQTSPDASDMSI